MSLNEAGFRFLCCFQDIFRDKSLHGHCGHDHNMHTGCLAAVLHYMYGQLTRSSSPVPTRESGYMKLVVYIH